MSKSMLPNSSKIYPNIHSYLFKRMVFSFLASGLVLVIVVIFYTAHLKQQESQRRLETSIHAYAQSIKPDLEFGDLWAARRILSTGINSGAFQNIRIENLNSGQDILVLPYLPKDITIALPHTITAKIRLTSDNDNSMRWQVIASMTSQPFTTGALTKAILLAVGALILLSIVSLVSWRSSNAIAQDIRQLTNVVEKIDGKNQLNIPAAKTNTKEALMTLNKLEIININLIKVIEDQKKLSIMAALGGMASQVAHDIRSPLAALTMIEKDITQLPETPRLIIRTAVNRIRDIANNLLEKNHERKPEPGKDTAPINEAKSEQHSIQLLSSLIDPLISEKRLQFRSQIGIEIQAYYDADSYGLFAKVQPVEFKRVISNLINNAAEALDNTGTVTVRLSATDSQAVIRVEDNGKGISPEILAKLGRRGETHGKEGGSGLGLYHARTSVETWGGALKITSELGQGTIVTLTLTEQKPPQWFTAKLSLRPDSTVVILDDDDSIHRVWDGRLNGVSIKHFSTPKELRNYFINPNSNLDRTTYLTDFELLGHQETGLDLVRELGIGAKSILVTSRFEEEKILEDCLSMGVRMIPKILAGFVPIEILSPIEMPDCILPDCILIDDDMLVHMTWKAAAKSADKQFVAFASAPDFFARATHFDKNTPVYIDVNLGNGISGEDVAKKVFEQGFKNIFLATGYEPERYLNQHLPFLKGVAAKDPPWL